MKKFLAVLLLITMLCSMSAAALAEEQVKLRLAYWGGPGEKLNMENTVKGFMEAYPNIKVELMHIPSDFQTKMQTMLASGTEPDLSYGNIMSFNWAKEG
ncbi:MAG: sugar ABC transporter substrate-binding protein, partial [Clostridia bacterium]